MAKILAKKDVGKFIKFLKRKYRVFTPVKKGNDFLLAEINSRLEEITNNLTILSPKKIFYPAPQVLFQFEDGEINEQKKRSQPIALLGLSALDINALSIFDKIMSKPHDRYYWTKRKNSLVIGLGEIRINLVGKFDLFFEEKTSEYIVIVGSNLGKSIIKNRLFKKTSIEPQKPVLNPDPLFLDADKLSKSIIASKNDRVWDDLVKICFGCGICTYVCPLCYCFDTKDEINLDRNLANKSCSDCSGKRSRYWDSCFLEHFFEVAGHNFKPELKDRIYNWYYHKFVRFPLEFGTIGCVSCERCIKYCPAKINYREVLEKILAKYKQ